jgi:hypothetical protein
MDQQDTKRAKREAPEAGSAMHAPQELPPPAAPFEPSGGAEALARSLVAQRTVAPDMAIATAIMRRFDTSGAPGLHAAGLGGRFGSRPLRVTPLPMTVSPYAPPQRQLSTARQGAPMWRPPAASLPATGQPSPEAQAPQGSDPAAEAPARVAVSDPDELPKDLKALLALHRAKGNI